MSTAIDVTYKYSYASAIDAQCGKPKLTLSTCDAHQAHPFFFDGKVLYPQIFGDLLITLSNVVRTHFFIPMSSIDLDPVLTSNQHILRLEGFSGCCGVYARVDLPSRFFEGNFFRHGTTNVDFNTPMRNGLKRLRDNEDVQFSVGKDEVVLTHGEEATIEKKVKLPLRWIKSFSEVQSYQSSLDLKMVLEAGEALQFLRGLPRASKPKMPGFVVGSGKSLRLSQRAQKGAIKILGTDRVKIIEPLLARAKCMKIWFDEENGTSAWEVCFSVGSFFLMISPEVYRGFSGEGQALTHLSKQPDEATIAQVRAQLKWQPEIKTADLSQSLGIDQEEVQSSLAALGSRGLVGFDANSQHYFHRELPFDLSKIQDLQPRLKNARKLLASNAIKRLSNQDADQVFEIPGSGVQHRVRLTHTSDICTCPWFSRYQGARGPCKHILAAQLFLEGEQ